MTTDAKNQALIVIDMQEGFNDPIWGKRSNPKLENSVERLLKHWRELGQPIFHVQHLSKNSKSPLRPNQPGVEFMACSKPLGTERVFVKSVNSCFIGTGLENRLRNDRITDLVFVGIASDHCVSTSTRMAANLGFECVVVSDATTSYDRKDQNGLIYPGDLVHKVNLASLHGEFAQIIETSCLIANAKGI